MAKTVDDTVLDAALNTIKNGAIRMAVCSSQPTTYSQIAGFRLAEATISSASFTGPAAGNTPSAGLGRRLSTVLQSGVSITGTGTQTANFVVLHNNSSVMYYVTTCTAQSLANGGTVNIPVWSIEIAGPV